jgi:hypothetical protein
MEQITKDKDNLIIKIPLKQEVYNPYTDEVEGEIDNIIGVIEGDKVGFAYLIDRTYKDKSPDISTTFYEDYMDKDEFSALCVTLGLDVYEYPICNTCKDIIYGTFTIDKKGKPMCFKCEVAETRDKDLTNKTYEEIEN